MQLTFTINGNSGSQYGCALRQGALKGLLAFPNLKKYDTNDWHEADGIEADLTAPVLDARQFDLPLYFGSASGYTSFFDELATASYHELSVSPLGIRKVFRFVSAGQPIIVRDSILVSARFSDDNPLDGYNYTAPNYTHVRNEVWRLDGLLLSRYGIKVLEGSRSQGWQIPKPKENLIRNIETVDGVIYDDHASKAGTYTFTLSCYMTHSSPAAFMACWNALLFDLKRPGARTITGDLKDSPLKAVYELCSVGDVSITGGLHVKFNLTFTAIINN